MVGRQVQQSEHTPRSTVRVQQSEAVAARRQVTSLSFGVVRRRAEVALLSAEPSNCVMPAIHDHADSAEEEPLVFKPVAPFSPALTKHGF